MILFFLEVLMYTFLTVTLVHLILIRIIFLAPDSDIIKTLLRYMCLKACHMYIVLVDWIKHYSSNAFEYLVMCGLKNLIK